MNNTSCLTTTLLVTRVVVGSRKENPCIIDPGTRTKDSSGGLRTKGRKCVCTIVSGGIRGICHGLWRGWVEQLGELHNSF